MTGMSVQYSNEENFLQLLQEEKQSHMVSLSNMGDELLLVHNQSSCNVTSTGCLGVSCQEIWKLCHGAFPFRNINSMVMNGFLGADSTSANNWKIPVTLKDQYGHHQ